MYHPPPTDVGRPSCTGAARVAFSAQYRDLPLPLPLPLPLSLPLP
jgi:hypothetical protein